MRLRKKRRRPVDLPPDDGLIPVLVTTLQGDGAITRQWQLQTPTKVHRYFAKRMREHDRRQPYERWGGNQWGDGWVLYGAARQQIERKLPLLKTDTPFGAYLAVAAMPKRRRKRD